MQTKKNLWTTNSHHKHFSLHYYHLNFQTQTLHCLLSLSLASFSVLSSISCKKLSLVLRQREGQEQSWSETCCLAWAWLLYLEAGIFIPNGKRRCFPKKKKKNRRVSLLQGLKSQNIEFFFSRCPAPSSHP